MLSLSHSNSVFLSFFGVAPIIGDFSSFFTKNFWTSSLTEIKPSRPRKKREPQGAAPPSIIGHYLLQLLPRLGRRGLGWISPKQHHDHQDIFWYPWNLFDLILVEGTYPACAPQALGHRCQAHVIYCNGISTAPHEMIFAAPFARACQPAPRRPSGFCCPLLKGPQIELTKNA